MLPSLLALGLGATTALAQSSKGGEGHVGGSFEDGGETQVSAMMVRVREYLATPCPSYPAPDVHRKRGDRVHPRQV